MMTQESLFDQPRARRRDPNSSHEAATRVTPAREQLASEILRVFTDEPLTPDQVARFVEANNPNRWAPGTIVSAISRLAHARRLEEVDRSGLSDRGFRCVRYRRSCLRKDAK